MGIRFLMAGLILIGTSVSLAAELAGECDVESSRFKDLASGDNEQVICQDTVAALIEEYGDLGKDYTLVIRPKWQVTYSAGLEIYLKLADGTELETSGIQYWYPGNSYVVLP